MPDALEARVISALAGIQNPRLENDLISSGMVRDLLQGGAADDLHATFCERLLHHLRKIGVHAGEKLRVALEHRDLASDAFQIVRHL